MSVIDMDFFLFRATAFVLFLDHSNGLFAKYIQIIYV